VHCTKIVRAIAPMNNLWPARHIAWRTGGAHLSMIPLMFFLSAQTGTVRALK
jgi:hypothetical protein